MEKRKAFLDIILHGDIFKEINVVNEEEQARMRAGDKMLYSKMADIYMEIFKCNDRIKLTKAECLGSWVIDDNNVVIDWEIDGYERCTIEIFE